MSDVKADKPYRPNVGIMVLNQDNHVWIGKRHGVNHEFAWQCPQGGVDTDEDLESAAKRELWEETGIKSVELIGRTKEWIYYDFPAEVRARRKIGKDFVGQKTNMVPVSLHWPRKRNRSFTSSRGGIR